MNRPSVFLQVGQDPSWRVRPVAGQVLAYVLTQRQRSILSIDEALRHQRNSQQVTQRDHLWDNSLRYLH